MTTVSLDKHLAVSVDPQLPHDLISEEHLRWLHALTERLPAGICEFFGFESRLGDAQACVDFLLCAKAAEGGRDVLAGLIQEQQLAAEFSQHPVWQQIQKFAVLWAQPDTPVHDHVQNIWLEFDMDGDASPTPVPCLFIGTNALFGRDGDVAPLWLIDQALPQCRGKELGADLSAALHTAIRSLPAHANIFQIGMMLGRQNASHMLRLCVRGLDQQQAQTYLQSIQWPGCLQQIQNLLSFVYDASDAVDLDFDLTPSVGIKIGFECSFGADRATPTRLAAFLNQLVEQGLCLDAKRKALMAWSGGFHERTDPARWPADLRARSANADTPTVSMFMRWVYHIKLVYVPGQALEAKAYLAVRQAWITPEFMRQMKASASNPPAV